MDETSQTILLGYFMALTADYYLAKRMTKGVINCLGKMGYEIREKKRKKS